MLHASTTVTGAVLLMAAIAYYLLQQTIIRAQGRDSILKKAVGRDWKGKLSPVLYIAVIVATLWSPWISEAILVAAALIWLIPDRRIEHALPRREA
jgi:TMEM175 potassium channel family protein